MNKIFVIVLSALLLFPCLSAALKGDDILGSWITEGADSRVEIQKKGNHYSAKIVSLKDPLYKPGEVKGMDNKKRMDLENPDKSLKNRPILGMEIMSGFKFDGKKWTNGKIYDPENGKTYKCNITLADDGKLHVRGYIGVSWAGRTTVWEKFESYRERMLNFLGPGCSCK